MLRPRHVPKPSLKPKALLGLGCGTASVLAVSCSALAQTTLPPVVVESSSRAVRPTAPTPQSTGTASAAAAPAQGASTSPTDTNVSAPPDGTQITAGDLLSNQGTATTVITGEQLRQQQARSPAEALRGIPGVVVGRAGGIAGLTQVGIRGAEGRHTIVLVDGIEANNPGDGEFDFSNLVGTEEIERIEVLRGPQSGLYGSGAGGGVINIVSRSGKGPLALTTRAEVGSYGTRDAAAVLSGGNDKAWGLLGMQQRKTSGFNISPFGGEKDASQTTSSIAKAGFSPLQGLTIEGVLRHTGKRGDRDGEDYETPNVLVKQIDTVSRFSSDLWLGALEGKLSLFDGGWVQSVRGERRSITNDDRDVNLANFGFAPTGFFERYRANAETYRYTSTFRLDTPGLPQVRHFLTGLAEQKHEGFVQYTDDGRDHERQTRSVVGEARGEYWNTLFLNGSIRRDDTDVSGTFDTWRTSASLKVPETPLRLHGSAGTGVKLPSLFEQYGRGPSFFVANPNLRPETSRGWDAGAELTLLGGRVVLDATWFETQFQDKIANRFVGMSATSVNLAGISTREGLEVSARLMPLPGLTIGGGYTWLEAKTPAGLSEVRRPGSSARFDAAYTFDRNRATVGLAAVYNGTRMDDALRAVPPCFPGFGGCSFLSERVGLDAYWLISATASYKLTPSLELYARGENLLDRRYQEVYGFETAGATVFAGLRMKLQDASAADDKPRP